ncbi:ATP-binding protein [Hahella sp. NBU794]|uniref:ATP-binding protein n=1 Tax=Hahella sp. NBU794 TaxID=3422590 RepID=UPI003D6FD43F
MLSFKDAVRKRPGMYFGDIDHNAVNHVVYELVANVVDLFLAGKATTLKVDVSESEIVVTDDGPGFPFPVEDGARNPVEVYLTHHHDKPTADDHAPHIHVLGGGLGLAAVNAVSEKLTIESSNGVWRWRQVFGKGDVLAPLESFRCDGPSGSSIKLSLDPSVFHNRLPDFFQLRKAMFELAHLYAGLIVEFDGERYVSKQGLLALAYLMWSGPQCAFNPKMFRLKGQTEDVEFEVAAIGEGGSSPRYKSWVNGCETEEHGAHVNGLRQALNNAEWTPDIALISIVMHDPKFAGPVKSRLCNRRVKSLIAEALADPLKMFNSKSEDN